MLLRDAVPGAPLDASPLARLQPGALPAAAAVVAPAAIVQGVVYIPVPGLQGLPGSVAGTIPWEQVTSKPVSRQERFLVTARGAQSILLTYPPLLGSLTLYWDGVRQFDISDLSLNGNNLTIPASWPLVAGDTLGLAYLS